MQTPDALSEDQELGPPEHPPGGLALPPNPISSALEKVVDTVGVAASYIWPILVAVIVINVGLRYIAGTGYVSLEELQWHLYSVGWLIGLGYTLQHDGHVRVDVLSERLKRETRLWIEFIGLAVFVLPFAVFVVYHGVPFVEVSFRLNEISASPGGLPYRWVLKSFIVIGFAVLIVAATARLLRVTSVLMGWPTPKPENTSQ